MSALTKSLVVAGAIAGSAMLAPAQAAVLTGDLYMSSGATGFYELIVENGGITGIDFSPDQDNFVVNIQSTGSFAPYIGESGTIADLTIAGFAGLADFISLADIRFDLTSITLFDHIQTPVGHDVVIQGRGVFWHEGDQTPGTFNMSSNSPDGTFFVWSADSRTVVAEPATLGLLGLGLAGIAAMRRRRQS